MSTFPFISTLRDIAREILVELDMYSDEALNLVMRTGAVETGYKHLEQMGDGPALGFWQVEKATADDIWYNFAWSRDRLQKTIYELTGIRKGPWSEFQIKSNLALQIILCRLVYWRFPEKIPQDVGDQADYWKVAYNTIKGKGSPEKFLEAVRRLEV